VLGRFLLISGLLMLGIYLGARVYTAFSSRSEARRLESRPPESRQPVAQEHVLAQVWFVSAADGVADVVKLRQDEQGPVLDLLHRIRHAVGTVHLNLTGGFIHRKLVVPEIEFAIRQSEVLNHSQLRGLLEVEVAGIVPAAHVHPRDVIAAFVLPVRC